MDNWWFPLHLPLISGDLPHLKPRFGLGGLPIEQAENGVPKGRLIALKCWLLKMASQRSFMCQVGSISFLNVPHLTTLLTNIPQFYTGYSSKLRREEDRRSGAPVSSDQSKWFPLLGGRRG